jgi:predicted ATPase
MRGIYRPEVFFVRSLGFVTPTEARRISLADSIRFGELHEEVYLVHGFKLIHIDPAPAVQRVESIKRYVEDLREPSVPFSD